MFQIYMYCEIHRPAHLSVWLPRGQWTLKLTGYKEINFRLEAHPHFIQDYALQMKIYIYIFSICCDLYFVYRFGRVVPDC